MRDEGRLLPLSGLQHFSFCPRQWALIHLEQQWQENLRTAEGRLLHTKAHDALQRERRGDTLILRDLTVVSHRLGLSGKCDVVEFHRCADGFSLHGEEGLWLPYPVEYKRGAPKEGNADRLQLCAQALCLEEMLCCSIPEGALFYGETRRRETVLFDPALRAQVEELSAAMAACFAKGVTPKASPSKGCSACSLRDLCLPRLARRKSASAYVRDHIREDGL